MNEDNSTLIFWLNDEKVTIANPNPNELLSEFLWEKGLTGTKVGCAQGGCGACTVMLSYNNNSNGQPAHRAINACLRPICALHGMKVTTVEGIGSCHDGLDPTQYKLAICNGTQCGFCTPGFVMNMHSYLQEKPNPVQQEIENIFGGNLCRCTGYRPILHGMRTFASDYDADTDSTMKCEPDPSFDVKVGSLASVDLAPLRDFPAEPLHFSGDGIDWWRPISMEGLLKIKGQLVQESGSADVKLMVGNTASVLWPNEKPKYLLDIAHIRELNALEVDDTGIHVGAAVSIQVLVDAAEKVISERPEEQTTGLRELVHHSQYIAGIQIRNAGSIAGNIAICRNHDNFPSDVFTVLATLGTIVTVASNTFDGGAKDFPLDQLPAMADLPEDAIMQTFHIPYTRPREYVQTYRVARRPQMSHAIVTAGFRFLLDEQNKVVTNEATVIFGGIASQIYRARKSESFMYGKAWLPEAFASFLEFVRQEIAEVVVPMEGEGISQEYRTSLAENYFYKFFIHVADQVNPKIVNQLNKSACTHFVRPLSIGQQFIHEDPQEWPLTRSIIKRLAFAQATGEAKYTQDMHLTSDGLYAELFKSTRPHARFQFTKKAAGLKELEQLLAKKYPDFHSLVTVADIPASKCVGLGGDDPVFCDGEVTSIGMPIGLVLAKSIRTARQAAAFVESECIDYEDLPAIITLEEAIEQKNELPYINVAKDPDMDVQQRLLTVTRADSDEKWLEDPNQQLIKGTNLITGEITTGAQAHFHMETMCALAIPHEYDRMTVYNSTQNPNGDQANIARTLGIQANQIRVVVEQIGGGFGAKQHRGSITGSQAAVAARKTRRPVRLSYDRETDMHSVGKRHPYQGQYYLAVRDDGTFEALRIDLKSDAGCTYDCSFAVMDLSLINGDSAYSIKTHQLNGTVYRTNKTSNTAFRTFGVIQSNTIQEDVIEKAAHTLSKKLGREVLPEELRRKNMYRNGTLEEFETNPIGQSLRFCNLRQLWDELWETSEFEKRHAQIKEFNQGSRWRKRGISMIPMKYGISFTEPRGALNASSALVNVNASDGSVFIRHGGVEIGQGLHTKIAQLAARTLGLPLELIHVAGNDSDAIVNAPATAASTGYDLNGGAVEKACRKLRQNLENFCETLENYRPHRAINYWRTQWASKWKEIVFQAWFHRVNLSVAELYRTPHYEGPSYRHPHGHPSLYFAHGVSCSEVEVDVLTGEFQIIRSDVLYDAGRSPNPAIDIGQLEGGFVQGVGYATTEEILYDKDGRLITDNIWNYKPPCTKTIPIDFRVKLARIDERSLELQLKEADIAVAGSKSTGEPGMILGLSAYFAIRQAVQAARRDIVGDDSWVRIDLPATSEKIQRSCCINASQLNP